MAPPVGRQMTGFVTLHGFDLVQVYITIGFALIAAINATRLTFTAPRRARPKYAVLAVLAYFYVAAYIVLLTGPWNQVQWTKAIRGPSWIVWVYVWAYLPWKLSVLQREMAHRTAALVPMVAEQIVQQVRDAVES